MHNLLLSDPVEHGNTRAEQGCSLCEVDTFRDLDGCFGTQVGILAVCRRRISFNKPSKWLLQGKLTATVAGHSVDCLFLAHLEETLQTALALAAVTACDHILSLEAFA